MQTNEPLFPSRLTRRNFLKTSSATAVGLALPALAADGDRKPVRIGSGQFTYELVEGWGALPDGMSYGLGCGVIVDSQDRVYVTSRSTNPCVAIFDRDGKLLETWGNEFAEKVGFNAEQVKNTAHCLYWSKEGNEEFIYWTENSAGGGRDGSPHIGARVYKTDLKGKILYQVGNVQKQGSTAQRFIWTNPTDVAVAPNGDIYVVDGYGSQLVSKFDKNFKHLKTIGGKGKEPGYFNTCHGVWVSTLTNEPEIFIADRANARFQVFDLDLKFKRMHEGDVRNPCCFYQHKGHLYIPDLASRVTIINPSGKAVAQLGDGKDVTPNGRPTKEIADQHPDKFFAPHAMTVDSRGDFYVVEWLPFGRVRKFKRVAV